MIETDKDTKAINFGGIRSAGDSSVAHQPPSNRGIENSRSPVVVARRVLLTVIYFPCSAAARGGALRTMAFPETLWTMVRRLSIAAAASAALVAMAEPVGSTPDLVFSVTEGVTYQATPKEIREKFEPLAEVIGKALRRNVRIVLVPGYDDVRAGLAKQEYDVAFIHPAHVAMAEIRAGRYRSIAWTSGFTDYTVSLLAKADEPVKDLSDLKGRKVVTPDPDSITAVMVRSMLRTGNVRTGDLKLLTTRYQDAVPFYLENGFASVAAGIVR